MARCKIHSCLSSALQEPEKVKILDLSHQQLHKAPRELGEFTQLEELDLSSNELSDLPSEILQLQSLKVLWLTGNCFVQVPREIFQLRSLERLYLSYNYIESLPELSSDFSLQALLISHNKLREIHHSWHKAKRLTTIIANCNKLPIIPEAICRLTNLVDLDFSENHISEVPAEIHWPNLQKLHIWNNHIAKLSEQISKCSQLQEFDISGNYLPQIPEQIGYLRNLQMLDLRKNKLQQIVDDKKPVSYKESQYRFIHSSYSHHYRRMLIPLLTRIEFCSNEPEKNNVLKALAVIKENFKQKKQILNLNEVILDGIL